MKHLHRAACAVGAVLLLAGCSSAPTAGVAGLAGGPGSIKIQAGSDEIPALQQIAEEFTADTGVEVEFVQREINAQAISNLLSGVRVARALVFIICASHTPVAMPQPISSRPSFMERGFGLRFDHPKRSAPSW